MQLLEEYQELVERDSVEISFLWKVVQTFFYILSAVTGYVCSILFYLLWQDIFGGNCPLWAKVDLLPEGRAETDDSFDKFIDPNSILKPNYKDWRLYIIVDYEYEIRCKVYFFICMFSCIYGTAWSLLFSMCGKGGYDVGMFDAPWRIVPPALFFNFLLTVLTIFATRDMELGYTNFNGDMQRLVLESSYIYEPGPDARDCEIVQSYLEFYNPREHNVCRMFSALQILSWIMTWSWIGGFLILILRVVIIPDFRLLKVKVYEVPQDITTTAQGTTAQVDSIDGKYEDRKDKEE